MNKKKLISLIVPCFNEEENVMNAYQRITAVTGKLSNYRFEYFFIDNGSTDNTQKLIKKLTSKDKSVIGIFLSRNFGPEASGQAGLDRARGDGIIGLGCDLQDPPEMIPGFLKKWEEGYDLVLGIYIRAETGDNPLISLSRKVFYRIFNKITDIDVPIDSTGFGIIDKKVLNALKLLPERYRFNRGLLAWVGFKKAYITYKRNKRLKGKSSYNFYSYIKFAERGVFGLSYLPLDLIIYMGFLLVFLSFIFGLLYLIYSVVFGNPIKGQISLMVTIIFFGGAQILATSFIGKYIQVIMEETKRRPIYIVEDIVNY